MHVHVCQGQQYKQDCSAICLHQHRKRAKFFSFMGTDRISKESKSAQQQLDDYLQLNHTEDDIKKGSLWFWENNSTKFPGLSMLAKKYLAVPATSAPIERVFSVAGDILRPERFHLCPQTLKYYSF